MLQALAVLGSAVLGGIIGFALCSLIKAGEGISHGSKLGSGYTRPSGLKVMAKNQNPKGAA